MLFSFRPALNLKIAGILNIVHLRIADIPTKISKTQNTLVEFFYIRVIFFLYLTCNSARSFSFVNYTWTI